MFFSSSYFALVVVVEQDCLQTDQAPGAGRGEGGGRWLRRRRTETPHHRSFLNGIAGPRQLESADARRRERDASGDDGGSRVFRDVDELHQGSGSRPDRVIRDVQDDTREEYGVCCSYSREVRAYKERESLV